MMMMMMIKFTSYFVDAVPVLTAPLMGINMRIMMGVICRIVFGF